MRVITSHLLAAPLVLALLSPSFAQKDKATDIKPDREWVDVVKDKKKAGDAPAEGVITDAKSFEKLWKAWRDDKVPEVDFKKRFVVVTLSKGGPNKPKCRAILGKDGDLKISAGATRVGGDGFGYSLAVFRREGVKKVNGKAVKGIE